MAAALLNRARMTTATTGTGTVTLGSAVVGYATFAEAGAVDATVYAYAIQDGNDIEIGDGTYTSSGTTFSRDTVTVSKISGTAGTSKINLSGAAEIFITPKASDLSSGVLTTVGDILYRGTTGLARLAKGTALQVLRQNSALTAPEWAAARELLTSDRTYYVRADGSDSNTGLVNDSGGAFLTIQKAFNVIQSTLDVGGYTVTIQKDNSTHTNGLVVGNWVGGGSITFDGGGGTISRTSAVCISTTGILGGSFTYQNVTLTTTTGGNCVAHTAAGTVTQGAGVVFGACAGNGHIVLQAPGAFWASTASYSITGGAPRHYFVSSPGAYLLYQSGTITLTGTPAFTIFANANALSRLYHAGTFSGAATGQRYNVSENASVNSGGGGASYFPGSSVGAVSTGGLYA